MASTHPQDSQEHHDETLENKATSAYFQLKEKLSYMTGFGDEEPWSASHAPESLQRKINHFWPWFLMILVGYAVGLAVAVILF